MLEEHAGRRAIITTHMWLGPAERPTRREDGEGRVRSASWHFVNAPKGRMRWHKIHGSRGNSPQAMWEKLVSRHPNIIMVISGDQSRTQSMRLDTRVEHGNSVHEMMFDYGGGRNVRLLRFAPAENRIRVITWNIEDDRPVESSSYVADPGQWQFSLDCALAGPLPAPGE